MDQGTWWERLGKGWREMAGGWSLHADALFTQHPHGGILPNRAEARMQAAFGDTEVCTNLLAY